MIFYFVTMVSGYYFHYHIYLNFYISCTSFQHNILFNGLICENCNNYIYCILVPLSIFVHNKLRKFGLNVKLNLGVPRPLRSQIIS